MMNLPDDTLTATFAGGCFWCTESDFKKVAGVQAVISGYTGGLQANPTYHEVCSGKTGHAEAVQVFYDPQQVTYEALLEHFWRMIDPTDAGGQFVDRGSQYRTAIFYHDENQRLAAEASRENIERNKTFDEPVVTEITTAGTFYPAEDYHQDYYVKNPLRYKFYRFNCGRDQRLEELWGAKS